jgi:hypothetical protein
LLGRSGTTALQSREEVSRCERFKLLPSPPMFVGCVALMFALSGTGYAAFKLPANSVTTAHVKDGTLLARWT